MDSHPRTCTHRNGLPVSAARLHGMQNRRAPCCEQPKRITSQSRNCRYSALGVESRHNEIPAGPGLLALLIRWIQPTDSGWGACSMATLTCPPPAAKEPMNKQQGAYNRSSLRVAIASIIVTVVLWTGNFAYGIWKDHRTVQSSDSRFANIETSLRLLTATVAPQLQKAIDDSLRSALSTPADTADNIRYAKAAISQLRESHIAIQPAAAAQTAQKLAELSIADKSSPEIWSTAAEFVTYRSESLTNWRQISLPVCTNEPLQFAYDEIRKDGHVTVTHGPITFSNCKIILDSPEASLLLSSALSIADVAFEHCVIFYGGGPIVLTQTSAALSLPDAHVFIPAGAVHGSIFFKDCFFRFTLQNIPPEAGRRLTRTLLASSDGATFQFEASSALHGGI